MLRWAVIFLVIAIIAGIFGFGQVSAGAVSIAMMLFYVFLAITVILFLMSIITGNRRSTP